MRLGDRFRQMIHSGDEQTRRRSRVQAQPIAPSGRDRQPIQRAQLIGLGLAAASAVALTAGLVFIILALTRPADTRAVPTPQPAAFASPSPTPLPISAIFATPTPGVSGTATLPPLGERAQVGNAEGGGVNLRAEPSTTAERLKVIPEGRVVSMVGPDRDAEGRRWRNVRDAEGTIGWMPAQFLVAEGSVPPSSASAASGPPPPEPSGSTTGPAPAQSAPGPAGAAQTTPVRAATATAAAKPSAGRGQVGNTGGQGANIRSEPGNSGRVLKTLAEGASVEMLGSEREADGRTWRQVRDSAGVTGWIVAGAIVSPGSVPTPAPPGARATAAPTGVPPASATSAPQATAPPAPAGAPADLPRPPSIIQPSAGTRVGTPAR